MLIASHADHAWNAIGTQPYSQAKHIVIIGSITLIPSEKCQSTSPVQWS